MQEPFVISSGSLSARESVVVKVTSGQWVGYGESAPMPGPFYNPETLETVTHMLKDFIIPAALKWDLEDPRQVDKHLTGIRGNNFAKAGIETAIWDLWAKMRGQSLSQVMGGVRKRIPSGVALGIFSDPEKLGDRVEQCLQAGYSRVKIKIQPGWDVEPVRYLRQRFGDFPLQVDANAAYTLEDVSVFQALDQYELTMIEQPLGWQDLIDHANLQSKINTALCLDESITSLDAARQAIAIGACRIVNIKIQRVGGLGPALAIHDYCKGKGIPLWCGTMPESGLGQSFGLALASLPGFVYPADVEPTDRFYVEDLVRPALKLKNGAIDVPMGPGVGVAVKEEFLSNCVFRKERRIAG